MCFILVFGFAIKLRINPTAQKILNVNFVLSGFISCGVAFTPLFELCGWKQVHFLYLRLLFK